MRELIWPTLFMIARTGLFLALAAWIVGLGTTVYVCKSTSAGRFGGRLTEAGWGVGFDPGITGTSPLRLWTCISGGGFENHRLIPSPGKCEAIPFPFGYSVAIQYEIPHWLSAAVFATFNIFLHVLYRKRSEAPPCGS